jgi:hypothetical protein
VEKKRGVEKEIFNLMIRVSLGCAWPIWLVEHIKIDGPVKDNTFYTPHISKYSYYIVYTISFLFLFNIYHIFL